MKILIALTLFLLPISFSFAATDREMFMCAVGTGVCFEKIDHVVNDLATPEPVILATSTNEVLIQRAQLLEIISILQLLVTELQAKKTNSYSI